MLLRLLLAVFIVHCVPAFAAGDESAASVEFFESKIRPLLINHCVDCHGPDAQEGGLRLDSRHGWETGGETGPALVPGNVTDSLLIKAIRYADKDLQMPPDEPLAASDVAVITEWVQRGAVDPRDDTPTAKNSSNDGWAEEFQQRLGWWSLQPLSDFAPPEIPGTLNPIDQFLQARRDAIDLQTAPPGTPDVLLRRLSFVLTGLPPTADERTRFLREWQVDADAAFEALVARLLSSPHFGERFARHWMDVVRYTDTYGYEWDIPAKGSWEYRDYLIRAFNSDVGYDQLVREQIAGDLLPAPRINHDEGLNESMIGPMFFHLGEHRHGSSLDFNGIHQEMIDNKIDAFSKTFLGMTVACARCHDHKIDAVSQEDYYALAGVLMTPRWTSRPIDSAQKYESEITALKHTRNAIWQQLKQTWLEQLNKGVFESTEFLTELSQSEGSTIDDVGYHVRRLLEATSPHSAADNWRERSKEWSETREQRQQHNAGFTVLTDFAMPGFPNRWVTDGAGIEHGHVQNGTPRIALEGDTVIADILPQGYHTHALSPKLPGAVRGPDASQTSHANVRVNIAGGNWAGSISIPQNAFLSEGPVFFDPAKAPAWTPIAAHQERNGVTRVCTEFATASLHPNFPPRTGVARSGEVKLPDNDEGFDKRSWFSMTGIVASDSGAAPAESLDEFEFLYAGPEPVSMEDARQRIGDWLGRTVQRWADDRATTGDVRVLNWLLSNKLLSNSLEATPEVAEQVERYRQIESQIGFPRSANSMDERSVIPVDYRLNLRGDVYRDGPAIRRNFLQAFASEHSVADATGSGRLELAEYLASGRNPQTARVYVNRVWQWVFGTGIVSTPNDFGRLGTAPSHPELLDWLSVQFMRDDWSTKELVRHLVLSETFRQSGQVSPDALEKDPGNRLLHHYPTRRLEAEAIRDAMLAVSGRLDSALYGRPINPYRRTEDAAKRLFSGPLDGNGRRSLYLEMSIMQPPEFLVGFNLPELKQSTGRRDVTNVPSQALMLLNDPLVRTLAEHWAAQLEAGGTNSPDQLVQQMFQTAFGRDATEEERRRWSTALNESSLIDLAHTIFNAKEFIYYR